MQKSPANALRSAISEEKRQLLYNVTTRQTVSAEIFEVGGIRAQRKRFGEKRPSVVRMSVWKPVFTFICWCSHWLREAALPTAWLTNQKDSWTQAGGGSGWKSILLKNKCDNVNPKVKQQASSDNILLLDWVLCFHELLQTCNATL